MAKFCFSNFAKHLANSMVPGRLEQVHVWADCTFSIRRELRWLLIQAGMASVARADLWAARHSW